MSVTIFVKHDAPDGIRTRFERLKAFHDLPITLRERMSLVGLEPTSLLHVKEADYQLSHRLKCGTGESNPANQLGGLRYYRHTRAAKWARRGLNTRELDLQSSALPTELPAQI